MKKMISVLLMAALASGICAATAVSASAATTTTTTNGVCQFVDKNGDGICDNKGKLGKGNGTCAFVDKDGDGICDNVKKTTAKQYGKQKNKTANKQCGKLRLQKGCCAN